VVDREGLAMTAIKSEERIGNQRLILGDCLKVMRDLGPVDAVVTDPPYGVNGGSGTLGKYSKKTKYSGVFQDTEQYIVSHVLPAICAAISASKRAIVTPGTPHCFKYPPPDDMGIIYQPATTGLNKWGRETSQPVLFYGKDPMSGLTIQPKHIVATVRAEDVGHPCPKPLYVARWMVSRASLDNETILDPFMGSGTTLVACQKLGRQGIGIEIDPDYFEIACKRVDEASRQKDLFVEPAPKPEQKGMDL
jgi:site-specific DNA-methyltransferase (adenine-specific)